MKLKQIDYGAVKKYWDSSFAEKPKKTDHYWSTLRSGRFSGPAFSNQMKKADFKYGEGYKIDDENFALLRFKTEVNAIKKILKKIHKDNFLNSFLDVGCGNGKFSFYFSNYFKEVVGIDFSKKSIAVAEKEALRRKKNINFHCADATRLNLKQKFDIIFVGGVLMYINDNDLHLVLANLKKHLAANGLLILREPFFKEKTAIKTGAYPVIYRSLKEFVKKLTEEHFKIVNLTLNEGYNYGIITDFYLRFLPKKIVFNLLAKHLFLKLNYFFLKEFIRCKGYFVAVKK